MGHIFQLGRKYAESLGLKVLDENGKLVTVTMGSYGVGVSRAVACVAEGNYDELGLVWPRQISPADVHVVATGKDDAVFLKAQEITQGLEAAGLEVLYDDRKGVSPGVKFKDSELIGVPTSSSSAAAWPTARSRSRTGAAASVARCRSTTPYGRSSRRSAAPPPARDRGAARDARDVRAVVFDWGGTLTPWHTVDLAEQWRVFAAEYHVDDEALARDLAARMAASEDDGWRRGRHDDHASARFEEILAGAGVVAGDPRSAAGEAAYRRFWEPHTWTDPQVRPLWEGLRDNGIRVGVLSNTIWSRDYHREVFARDGVLHLLDADVYSSETPWVKPHPEIFRLAARGSGSRRSTASTSATAPTRTSTGPSRWACARSGCRTATSRRVSRSPST